MKGIFASIKQDFTVKRLVIFIFIIIYCGCYYQQYQVLISLSYLLIGCVFLYSVLFRREKIFKNFIVGSTIFVVYSIISSLLWAYDTNVAIDSSMQLIKSVLIALIFISLLNSDVDFEWALFSFSLAGILYAVLYLQNVDISHLGADRISRNEVSDGLPNVNTVALLVSFSFLYFMYMYFYGKRFVYLIIAAIVFVITFLLGARKSIITLVIGMIMMLFKLNATSRVKLLTLSVIFIVLLIIYIPPEYLSFVSERLAQLNFFENKVEDLDKSDTIRALLLERGFVYWLQSPFIGNGYYNFSQLLLKDCGFAWYSHNNFLEALVGGGVVGFILYYRLYFNILKDCLKRKLKFDIIYYIFIVMVVLLFNQLFIVVLHERFIWILLAILYAGVKLNKDSSNNENRLCRR